MKNDKSLLAILIGFAAGPVIEIYTQIMKHFGLTTITALEAISLMWLREPSWLLGNLGALGISAWVSLIIYTTAPKFGEPINTNQSPAAWNDFPIIDF
jgi:hypothetical protein